MVALYLSVSNQSFAIDPVDINVFIDGEHAIQGMFVVGDQHNRYEFVFYLPRGDHLISAATETGSIVDSWSFSLESDEYWAVIDFSSVLEEDVQEEFFTWYIRNSAIAFV